MRVLGFDPRAKIGGGHRVREARFESRSMLPVTAACVIANSVRERLAELFDVPVTLRLLEPVLPDAHGWSCICDGALLYSLSGRDCDAAIILRRDDALSLAGAALGERIDRSRALSAIEGRVVGRLANALANTLTTICGPQSAALSQRESLTGYTTYFELIVEEPVRARLGIALSREPLTVGGAGLDPACLNAVKLTVYVEGACGLLPAASIARMRIGDVVPFESRIGEDAFIRCGPAVVARGECGEIDARRAVVLR